ncbi:CdaR family transcriptional regulator [Paramaledivibacter caminithermalis]|jgi:carbohydrate diacid regulator|uniref:Carbohydrate diacid regulator n=1 Tax=Paramaledivibacter caminithermalis (strain DSM 15212 / CIP 107654 / DViRD3) TaxID=1121301 RepID=A0A1M6TSK9_PARC5|nr:sugar diacid recognition domain-containing protein [Paramaledivibacter caminithermalis]SHK59893.1 carbohydrate diacid regulator [Paramaledivibacter caminithermalis DSM 15212]
MKLSKQLAGQIVKEMMKVIPYNVNVMNEKGIIIGSGNKSRIGSLHEGAVKAIEKKEKVEVYEVGRDVKPGVNEPILIDGKPVGVVGITGDPDEVRPLSQLVSVTTTLLIEQATRLKAYQEKEKQMEEFLYELVYRKKEYDKGFYELANKYGVNLDKDYRGIILIVENMESFEKNLKKTIPMFTHFLRLDNHRIVLFLEKNKGNDSLIQKLEHVDKINKIGIGDFYKPFSISFEKATLAIEIGLKIKPNQKIYTSEEFEFFMGLKHRDKANSIQLIHNLEIAGEKLQLVKTLQTFIEKNGEMNEVAKNLNIHRNTLNYRIEKIYELTGRHPKKLLDLVELIAGLIWS